MIEIMASIKERLGVIENIYPDLSNEQKIRSKKTLTQVDKEVRALLTTCLALNRK